MTETCTGIGTCDRLAFTNDYPCVPLSFFAPINRPATNDIINVRTKKTKKSSGATQKTSITLFYDFYNHQSQRLLLSQLKPTHSVSHHLFNLCLPSHLFSFRDLWPQEKHYVITDSSHNQFSRGARCIYTYEWLANRNRYIIIGGVGGACSYINTITHHQSIMLAIILPLQD